jgi:hypothetical protein
MDEALAGSGSRINFIQHDICGFAFSGALTI